MTKEETLARLEAIASLPDDATYTDCQKAMQLVTFHWNTAREAKRKEKEANR